ncbi:vWA domain-containing protein [Thermofilum pendens]|uniref:von Willebrand factor, type A n=1 Tax=Thermofilum pendens (strain DSM 2475 / Hrk 5) TaxID=368408 RepID=A1S120_THEPD|nr:vWA domain-containing protein [Thermofilum pendens]ABL79150.1 von Willebrand factor, type A [Thermofilum pendens Hrk 5]
MYLVFGKAYLLLLAPASLLAIYAVYRRAKRVQEGIRRALPGELPGLTPRLALASAIALLLVLAASEPRVVEVKRVELPLEEAYKLSGVPTLHVVVLDESKSMLSADVYPDRCTLAKRFAEKYIEGLQPSDLVVLVFFSSSSNATGPLPRDNALRALDGYTCRYRYTALGDALVSAYSVLAASGLPGAVVVVSDGGWNYGSDPLQVAQSIRASNYSLVLVRVGGDPRGSLMRDVASKANGKYLELDAFSQDLAPSIASNVSATARYEALRLAGLAYADVTVETPVGREPLLLLAALLAALLFRDGL